MNKTFLRILRIATIIVCLVVICYEGYKVYDDQKDYKVADTEYEEIKSAAITWPGEEDASEIVGYPLIDIDFDKLEEINSDFIAWFYFPALEISYPVVKENEIDQYLYKTFDGTNNKAGCLFEDVLSDKDFCGMHDIIFGHNMKNLSMFGSLKLLYKQGNEHLLEEKPYVYIYTRDHVYQYEVFAYYTTNVGSLAYSVVKTDEEYDSFAKYISSNSIYAKTKGYDLSQRPGILTLSTCSGASGSGRRFVVHTCKTASFDR